MGLLAGAIPAARRAAAQQAAGLEIQKGPFKGTRESLKATGSRSGSATPSSASGRTGARSRRPSRATGTPATCTSRAARSTSTTSSTYGHPSKFGFKDIIPTWKAEKFDPDHLMDLYKKAGAKYFMSMGVHHDNFDLWNSKHTRWNAVNMGPKKDIVGLFRKAALKHGLKFGVSEHLWISYNWFGVSHGSDKTGPLAGVPYDGTDPKNFDLYHDLPKDYRGRDFVERQRHPRSWKRHWFDRIKDLVDNYQPDLLYTDGPLPFEEYGLSLVAHLYNLSANRHGGEVEAVYTSKRREDSEDGTCVLDFERGVADTIGPTPGRPTPASATGTTRATSSTRRPRRSSTCWWISSAATAT